MSPENREKLDLAVVEIWKNVPFRIYDIVDGWVKPPLIGRYAIIDENTAVLCIMGEIAKRIKNKMDALERKWTGKPTQHTPCKMLQQRTLQQNQAKILKP